MRNANPKREKERAAEGKRTPLAREPRVDRQQNGEVEPLRTAAKKQRGTDESKRR